MFDKRKFPLFTNCFISVVLLLCVFVLLSKVDFYEIKNAISLVPLKILLCLLCLQLLTQCLLAMQWKGISSLFLQECRFTTVFYILSTGSVIESLTPGAKIGGEVTRLYYLKKELQATTEEATQIILLQKSISMSVLFGVCLSSMLYAGLKIKGFFLAEQRDDMVFVAFFLFALFLFFLFGTGFLVRHMEGKLPHKLDQFLLSYHNSVKKLSKRQWLFQFSISTAVWVLFPIKMVILVNEMGLSTSSLALFAITMSAYMIGMLPITPGGLGTFEGAVVTFFSFLDVSTELALAIAIVFRFVTFWFVMLFSTFYVILYRQRRKYEP